MLRPWKHKLVHMLYPHRLKTWGDPRKARRAAGGLGALVPNARSAKGISLRFLSSRAGHVAIALGLALLLVMHRANVPQVSTWRMTIADVTTPVAKAFSAPMRGLRDLYHTLENWVDVHDHNVVLLKENAALRHWQSTAKQLEAENKTLRTLLSVIPSAQTSFVTAEIVSDTGSAFSQAALINAGRIDGVKPHQAVINARGLLGQVIEVGTHSARVLLLSDTRARVPVTNARTREKMMLAGRNTGLPALLYVGTDTTTQTGDTLMTSGDGGIFPKDIPVAVAEMQEGPPHARLLASITETEYVLVLESALAAPNAKEPPP